MAHPHPSLIVEQFVRQFLSQWHVGLQPSLTLNTEADGAITIGYKVTTATPNCNSDVHQLSQNKGRSGRGSRARRRKKRCATVTPNSQFQDTPPAHSLTESTDNESSCAAPSKLSLQHKDCHNKEEVSPTFFPLPSYNLLPSKESMNSMHTTLSQPTESVVTSQPPFISNPAAFKPPAMRVVSAEEMDRILASCGMKTTQELEREGNPLL